MIKTSDVIVTVFAAVSITFGIVAWSKVVRLNDQHTLKVMSYMNRIPHSISREEAFLTCEGENP